MGWESSWRRARRRCKELRDKGLALIDLSHQDLLALLVLLVGRGRDAGARPEATDSVSDPARARRARARLRARPARDRPATRPRARRRTAAAPLRGRVLHLAARPAREPPAGRAARGRPRAPDDRSSSRSSHTRSSRSAVGGGIRARRRRLTHRSDRRDGDHAPARRAAPDRLDRRGREPGQRRHRARRLPLRRRRGGQRHVLALGGGISFVLNVLGGVAVGVARRVDRAPGAPPARLPACRGDDFPAHRLFRLHPCRADRRLGRDRGGDRRGSTWAGTHPS